MNICQDMCSIVKLIEHRDSSNRELPVNPLFYRNDYTCFGNFNSDAVPRYGQADSIEISVALGQMDNIYCCLLVSL